MRRAQPDLPQRGAASSGLPGARRVAVGHAAEIVGVRAVVLDQLVRRAGRRGYRFGLDGHVTRLEGEASSRLVRRGVVAELDPREGRFVTIGRLLFPALQGRCGGSRVHLCRSRPIC